MSRTELTRLRTKERTDRSELDALLDSSRVGHFAIATDAGPRIVPTAVVRDGDRVLAHGSTGSPWMRVLASGAPTCLAVTQVDGIVVARSAFESSIHYRSAVLFGRCTELRGDEKAEALDRITDALIPGRVAEVRRSTDKELAATLALSFPIAEWSLKVSDGWLDDAASDVAGDAWAGVLPLTRGVGAPLPAPDLRPGIPVPPSVEALQRGTPPL